MRAALVLPLLVLSAHGAFAQPRDPVAAVQAVNASLSSEDRETKFDTMASSPFVFYRGTAHLFWADLAQDPRVATFSAPETTTWVQGDMHALNFGAFDGPQGNLLYDLNDFDEGLIADYQLDVWRLATSLILLSRSQGFSNGAARDAVNALAESYLDALRAASGPGNDAELRPDPEATRRGATGRLEAFLATTARRNDREEMLDRWTRMERGERVLDLQDDDLGPPDTARAAELRASISDYVDRLPRSSWRTGHFEVKSVARRLNAGTGSLGSPRYYVLIEGESSDPDDDRILDVKLQGEPAAWSHLTDAQRALHVAAFPNAAARVAIAQRALGPRDEVDDHAGWLQLGSGTYSVRERSPFKETLPAAAYSSPGRLEERAHEWGKILATAHARADEDFDPGLVPHSFDDAVTGITDGRHREFRALVRAVAFDYAEQVESDYAAFVAWRQAGSP